MVRKGDRTAALEHTVIRDLGPTVRHAVQVLRIAVSAPGDP
jgi:hypothetical protein